MPGMSSEQQKELLEKHRIIVASTPQPPKEEPKPAAPQPRIPQQAPLHRPVPVHRPAPPTPHPAQPRRRRGCCGK